MVRIESKQPRKQRKARYTAPAHARNNYLRAPLAPALREQYHRRSARVVTGDTVKVLRGESAGTEGSVDMVDTKRSLIVVRVSRSTRRMEPKSHALSRHPTSR